MKRYCLALDLQPEPALIAEYEDWHRRLLPGIRESILESGIVRMEIYRLGERLFMVMETKDSFRFEEKRALDLANPVVQQWEEMMWKYQRALPQAAPGEKWMLMEKIFTL